MVKDLNRDTNQRDYPDRKHYHMAKRSVASTSGELPSSALSTSPLAEAKLPELRAEDVSRLKQLTTPGAKIERLIALVEACEERSKSNGGSYLAVKVRDLSGSLDARIWDGVSRLKEVLKPGTVVELFGSVDSYRGVIQLKLDDALPSSYPPSIFFKRTNKSVEALFTHVKKIVESMQEPATKYVCGRFLEYYGEKVLAAPAAKSIHHAWQGGLLEHVVSLLHLAEAAVAHLQGYYERPISRDKVMFGIICHDLGKCDEYDSSNPAYVHTPRSMLINHVVEGPVLTAKFCDELIARLPVESLEERQQIEKEKVQLMHILAAHHGTPEWGSSVVPATLEALIVHHLDNLDAKTAQAVDLIRQGDGDIPGFTRSTRDGGRFLTDPTKM